MGLFGLFGKGGKQNKEAELQDEDLDIYSGMRVEVVSDDKKMFLVGTLIGLRGDRAQIRPSGDGSLLDRSEGERTVTLRGYSSKENKAVVMGATIRPGPSNMWQVEHLSLVKRSNDRAYFRVDTNVNASISPVKRLGAASEGCRLVNISVGGVCLSSEIRHNIGDKFLLKVKLLQGKEPFLMMCQILRIIERRHGYFEYGCRFLEMSGTDEERILQTIFEMQRLMRG